jgi:hypothetical protein
MEELSKLVELVKQEAPQARVKVDSLMVTHYFTMEELLDICNKYAEYKCALTNVSQQRELLIAELKEWELGYVSFNNLEKKLAEKLLKAINCA